MIPAGPRPLLFCLLLLCGFMHPAGNAPFRGKLSVNPRAAGPAIPAGLKIQVKGSGRLLAQASPDSTGHFSLDIPPGNDSAVDFFCSGPGLDTLFLRSVAAKGMDSAAEKFLFPCEPDTTAAGDIICPKCRRDDQVYPMTYGDPIVITRHFDTTGKVSYERTPKAPAATDTLVRAARYYCRRDKITF